MRRSTALLRRSTAPRPEGAPMEDKQQWPLYEVFVRARGGLDHKHVGSLHASDARMAIDHARDLYTRRQEGVSIWVVPSNAISRLRSRRKPIPCSSRRATRFTAIPPSMRFPTRSKRYERAGAQGRRGRAISLCAASRRFEPGARPALGRMGGSCSRAGRGFGTCQHCARLDRPSAAAADLCGRDRRPRPGRRQTCLLARAGRVFQRDSG